VRGSFAIRVLGIAAALLLSAPTFAADPADLERELTISMGGIEKTLSLADAMEALNIQSVSLALIDQTNWLLRALMAEAQRPRHSTRRRRCRNS
jgi:hypothetical protein